MFVVIVMRMTETGPVFEAPCSGTQVECAKRAMELRRRYRPQVEEGAYAAGYARIGAGQ